MRARVLDGKALAKRWRAGVARQVARLRSPSSGGGAAPGLATLLVNGPHDAGGESARYVARKRKLAEKAGIRVIHEELGPETTTEELIDFVTQLAAVRSVDAILVQLPLPERVDPVAVQAAIDPLRDVDALHPANAGRLAAGDVRLVPPTPLGVSVMLAETGLDLAGARALVIGRSALVGRPMAALLTALDATVTLAHSRTRGLDALCREADVVVAACGRPALVRGAWLKQGAVVIDVGITGRTAADGSWSPVGDVAFDEAAEVAGWVSPVPGGVGPMTIAALLHNVVVCAHLRRGLPAPAVELAPDEPPGNDASPTLR